MFTSKCKNLKHAEIKYNLLCLCLKIQSEKNVNFFSSFFTVRRSLFRIRYAWEGINTKPYQESFDGNLKKVPSLLSPLPDLWYSLFGVFEYTFISFSRIHTLSLSHTHTFFLSLSLTYTHTLSLFLTHLHTLSLFPRTTMYWRRLFLDNIRKKPSSFFFSTRALS